MQPEGRVPFSVRLCLALVEASAVIIPADHRSDWLNRWSSDIQRRWLFLHYAGFWNHREALQLLFHCIRAVPEALCLFVWRDPVRIRTQKLVRSPWTCLGFFAVSLVAVAFLTNGLSASRELLTSSSMPEADRLLFIWRHPVIGGGDRGFPSDVVPAWAKLSHKLDGVAPFQISHAPVTRDPGFLRTPLVILTEASLFKVLPFKAALGRLPEASSGRDAIVLDWKTWKSEFHSDPKAIGSLLKVDGRTYPIVAVLASNFHFVSRTPSLYLVQNRITASWVMVVAQAKHGATEPQVDAELTKIAEEACYYFYNGQLRIRSLRNALLTPFAFFSIAVVPLALLSALVLKVRPRTVWEAWRHPDRGSLRRGGFALAKTLLALAVVFTLGLEWSRSEASVLFASRDPASGPFLVWFYIAGAMAVLFWAIADQRTRCRECLRLLAFPVRIGSPGSFFLTWSGTELLCSEGHGVLHIPLLAPSWDDESEHWISLDDSWRSLFTS